MEVKAVKDELTEQYRRVCKLQIFRDMNELAVRKLRKRCRRMIPDWDVVAPPFPDGSFDSHTMNDHEEMCTLPDPNSQEKAPEVSVPIPGLRLEDVKASIEAVFAEKFCQGDVQSAQTLLLVRKRTIGFEDGLRVGLRSGMCIVMLGWLIWDCIVDPTAGVNLWNDPVLHVYTVTGNFAVYLWVYGCMLYAWQSARISYGVLFQFYKHKLPTFIDVFEEAAVITLLYMLNLVLYYKARRHLCRIPAWILPVIITLACMGYNLYPYRATKGLVKPVVLWKVFTAPFHEVTFWHSFVGDLLTSMVKPMASAVMAACYFYDGAFLHPNDPDMTIHNFGSCTTRRMSYITSALQCLPLLFRFMQCNRRLWDTNSRWPHMFNAIKYLLALSVVLFGVFNPDWGKNEGTVTVYQALWIVAFVLTTIYSFIWDVWQDWGLFQYFPDSFFERNPRGQLRLKGWGLRKSRLYARKSYYYVAIVLDLVFRFLWTTSLIPLGASNPLEANLLDQLQPFLAAVELCRRMMWGCLRLENQQIASDKDFQTVKNVPLDFDQQQMQEELDEKEQERSRRTGVVDACVLVVVLVAVAIAAYGTRSRPPR